MLQLWDGITHSTSFAMAQTITYMQGCRKTDMTQVTLRRWRDRLSDYSKFSADPSTPCFVVSKMN